MTDATEGDLDSTWLNDRSEFQMSFVHGLKNDIGLQIQYQLVGTSVHATWTPTAMHVGFPGFVHGGLLAAVLDDVMGRYAALLRRWAVTARFDVRYRTPAPLDTPLRVIGTADRIHDKSYHGNARIELPDGEILAEGSGLYLSLRESMARGSLLAWPGFEAYLPRTMDTTEPGRSGDGHTRD